LILSHSYESVVNFGCSCRLPDSPRQIALACSRKLKATSSTTSVEHLVAIFYTDLSSSLLGKIGWNIHSLTWKMGEVRRRIPLHRSRARRTSFEYHHSKSPKRPSNVHQQSSGVGSPTRSREQVAKTVRGERSRQVASDYTYCVM
jgi:hypothetical protein